MPRDNKEWQRYICKETYWTQLIDLAKEEVANLSLDIQEGQDVDQNDAILYFRSCRQLHFKEGFHDLQNDMKSSSPADKQPELIPSSVRRLVYR